jgi:hypothetical protein
MLWFSIARSFLANINKFNYHATICTAVYKKIEGASEILPSWSRQNFKNKKNKKREEVRVREKEEERERQKPRQTFI